jgi:hypothetical protein
MDGLFHFFFRRRAILRHRILLSRSFDRLHEKAEFSVPPGNAVRDWWIAANLPAWPGRVNSQRANHLRRFSFPQRLTIIARGSPMPTRSRAASKALTAYEKQQVAEIMHRVDVTARRVFQERWFRDNGKSRGIEPAVKATRGTAAGLAGIAGRAGFSACYCAAFGVALPVFAFASLFASPTGSSSRRR